MSMTNFSPGPAQYNPDFKQKNKTTTYKYTMLGRRASASGLMSVPGPGAYELKPNKLKVGGKFGKDQNRSLSLSSGVAVPGPGTYGEDAQSRASKHPMSPKYT